MPLDLQILLVGAAAALDTALLHSVLDRRNRRHMMLPIVVLLCGTWMFHCGELVRLVLIASPGRWAEWLTWLAMSIVACGLLLMPSSLLHGVFRLWWSGLGSRVKPRPVLVANYSPLLLLPWAINLIARSPGQPLLIRLARLVTPFTSFLCLVSIIAIVTLLWLRRRNDGRDTRRFLTALALMLVGITGLLAYAIWIAEPERVEVGSPLLVALILAPSGPWVLFTYFVIRYRFLPVLLERSLVYGAMLAAVLLLHRLTLTSAIERLGDRYRIDLGIVEGIVVFLLVLLYRPFRHRVSEAMRYLLGRPVTELRERTRRLAVELWQHLHDEPQPMVDWFVAELRESFEIRNAAAWLFEADGRVLVQSGDVDQFPAEQAAALHRRMKSHSFVSACGSGTSDLPANDLIWAMQASLAVRLDHSGFSGLLLLGRRSRAREYGEEETNAVLLLVELLGATLHSHYLESQRQVAERLAAQNEKLSALGMLTSCLAHELKNPLSSIKTIATVMAEQSGDGHEHAEDLRLILSEVERMADTTGRFLKFARPGEAQAGTAHRRSLSVQPVIDGVVQVLAGLAKSRQVRVTTSYEPDLPAVAAEEHLLRDIFFNLLLNAIEALERGGLVAVDLRRHGRILVATVRDDGPGIAAEVGDRLFAPFTTSKSSGTGLGLFMVRRNVEQLGGEVACECQPGKGTCFTVMLPFSGG